MKIVLLLHSYFKYKTGGSEYQAYILAKELVKKGIEVHYIFVNSTHANVPTVDKGIYLHPIKQNKEIIFFGKPFFIFKSKIIDKLNKIEPDYIYHRNLSPYLGFACQYCLKNNCKTIWHVASKKDVIRKKVSFKSNPILSFLNIREINFGIKNTDFIITQENIHNELILKNFGREDTNIVNKFFPTLDVRKKMDQLINVIWIANIKPVKQLELFIELASRFKNEERINFKIIGRMPQGNYKKAIVEKIEKAINIDYMGELSIEEVNKCLLDSHILINTSQYEGGAPVTFIQAWMSKVPILSLNVNPNGVFNSKKYGFCSNSIKQMEIDLHTLIADKQLLEKMGEESYKFCNENYSLKNIDKLLNIVQK